MALLRLTPQFRSQDKHTSQQLTLEGITIQLETYTNKDSGDWCFDIKDSNGVTLVAGIGLVAGVDLLAPYRYITDLPPGQLFVFDQTGESVDPGLDSFIDGEAILYYNEAG